MQSQILFTIETFSGEIISIYGPTNERLQVLKPVNSNIKYGSYIVSDRNKRLKELENWKVRNKYFKEGRLEFLENEKKKIIMETNWKLRVLIEQEKVKIEQEKVKIEQHNEQEKIRIEQEKIDKEAQNKERAEKAKKTRENNIKKYTEQPLRRSSRLINNI